MTSEWYVRLIINQPASQQVHDLSDFNFGAMALVACHTFPIETTRQYDNTQFSRSPYHFPSIASRTFVLAMVKICVIFKLPFWLAIAYGRQDHVTTHEASHYIKFMEDGASCSLGHPAFTFKCWGYKWHFEPFFFSFTKNKNKFHLLVFDKWNKLYFTSQNDTRHGDSKQTARQLFGVHPMEPHDPKNDKAPRHD